MSLGKKFFGDYVRLRSGLPTDDDPRVQELKRIVLALAQDTIKEGLVVIKCGAVQSCIGDKFTEAEFRVVGGLLAREEFLFVLAGGEFTLQWNVNQW